MVSKKNISDDISYLALVPAFMVASQQHDGGGGHDLAGEEGGEGGDAAGPPVHVVPYEDRAAGNKKRYFEIIFRMYPCFIYNSFIYAYNSLVDCDALIGTRSR